ncbi:putative N(4)-(beta-N-acetylglucosaminyl)-L-asparaginase [Candidatus Sulfopaludibacter sp. SbA3]|nr:putative N(4)-(beta-N-acetylglucosaminyl)-L-asparaginase [Candidatus Sulfopaludibacter sp. SbA3]
MRGGVAGEPLSNERRTAHSAYEIHSKIRAPWRRSPADDSGGGGTGEAEEDRHLQRQHGVDNGGVNCCAKAMEVLQAGGDTLDAVIAGVNIVELNPNDTSVGYGGLPNEEGIVELDASCIHGPTRRGGAVGAIRGCKTPSKIAKLVLAETDHMMLVGEGASHFARMWGYPEEDLLTDRSRLAWRMWKREMRDRNGHTNWESQTDAPPGPKKIGELKKAFPGYGEDLLEWAYDVAMNPPHGTINCIALNEKGEMSAVTTTSGMAWKIAGRLGDSPILGGGLWLDPRGRIVARPGCRRGRVHGSRRREYQGLWRAYDCGEHAPRDVAERVRAGLFKAGGAQFR